MDSKIKVAHIGFRALPSEYPVGGIEHWIESVTTRLKSDYIFYLYPKSKYTVNSTTTDNVRIHPTSAIWTKNFETLTYSLIATMKAILFADVIHYHGNLPALWSFIPRFFNKKVVLTLHGADWKRKKWGKFMKCLQNVSLSIGLKCSDEVVSVSEPLLREIFHRRQDLKFIPNGVDRQFDILETKGNRCFGYIGRLVPEKKIELLIEAFNDRRLRDCKLIIAGESPSLEGYFQRLKNMASSNENIIFLGAVKGKEKEAFFNLVDVICLPSQIEGMPIALLEACQYKKRLILSNIAEHTFFSRYILSGVSYFNEGCLSALKESLITAKTKKHSLQLVLGEDFYKRFCWNVVSNAYGELYNNVQNK